MRLETLKSDTNLIHSNQYNIPNYLLTIFFGKHCIGNFKYLIYHYVKIFYGTRPRIFDIVCNCKNNFFEYTILCKDLPFRYSDCFLSM